MRAVIVDDNEIDRMNLRTLLTDHPQIEIAGEAATLDAAVALIEKERPDAVFLDIHLGRHKGFGVLDKISCKPQVIITTSHPHYALKGFEIDAVDYLLKPVTEEVLARAVSRLSHESGEATAPLPQLELDDVQLFKQSDGLHVVPVAQILAMTGERIYSRVLVRDGQTFLHNRSLREWKDILPERQFKALDRSTIVNAREILSILPDNVITFRNSTHTLTVGETALKVLRDSL